jgi:hypothetical protein
VVVDEVTDGPKGKQITVFVPRWNEHEALVLPEITIPEHIRPHLKKGAILIALVNTEAERSEDLFFEDFELTPDEDLDHGPA